MKERDLNDILVNMCEKHMGINFNKNTNLKKHHFFSRKINASASEMAIFLLEIEKKFKIVIENEFILNGKFSSFDNIYYYLLKKCTEI